MDTDDEDILVRLGWADAPDMFVRLEPEELRVREEPNDISVPPGVG